MEKIKIGIILGTTRPGRFSDKPGKWLLEEANKIEGVQAELLDLREYPLPFFDEVAPTSDLGGKYSTEVGKKWASKIGEFDAYIVVTAEYNHGYPAVLKNALDYVYAEWNKKPVSFVGYGYADGVRAVEQLRQVVIQLDMVPVSTSIQIPQFWTRTDEQGNFKAEGLEEKAKSFFGQLLWWAKATKAAREAK